ncbi:MAG: transglutaminase domain-containing protein [Gammaproteobacteria bacterium]|nr:transglutaminase domain-containing protein [Gammaproteobacteria bacterium]MCP5458250.1 transglutaminase domain-containing protein [Gammaproteobacteria bacterium]
MAAMKPPPLLLGAALLLWGWRAETLPLAVGLAVVLELPFRLAWRWRLRDKDINYIVDFCTVVLAAWVVYAIAIQTSAHAVIVVLQGLPVIVFPLIALQRYGDRDGLPLSALSLRHRRWGRSQRTVEVGYPYLVACLVAASPGERGATVFFLLIVVLWFWALWPRRNRRYAAGMWLGLAFLVSAGAFALNGSILALQAYLEQQVPEWLLDWFDVDRDPYRRSTALGSIGRLKLSDAIIMRVAMGDAAPVVHLLRTGSYNLFGGNVWYARSREFAPVSLDEKANWALRPVPGGATRGRVEIVQDFKQGTGMLPLPLGAYRVVDLPAATMQRNALGSVKVMETPDFADYRIAFAPTGETDPVFGGDDLQIPEQYRKTLDRIVTTLGLRRQPRAAPDRLTEYFNKHFEYSLDLSRINGELPPLEDFLLNTHSGHCEYFATATVLLLRAAGIPARYAAGFSVQEYSALEGRYIVRGSHGHAWALAYLDGHWQDVDTTPPVWGTSDAEHHSSLIAVYDVLSWLWVKFKEWRLLQSQGHDDRTLLGWLAPLVLLLIWRLRHRRWVRRSRPTPLRVGSASADWPGSDSEFYRIIEWYGRRGWERSAGEPLRHWLTDSLSRDRAHHESLDEMVRLHYRYRFDPRGLESEQRARLSALVQDWFARLDR